MECGKMGIVFLTIRIQLKKKGNHHHSIEIKGFSVLLFILNQPRKPHI